MLKIRIVVNFGDRERGVGLNGGIKRLLKIGNVFFLDLSGGYISVLFGIIY